MLTQIDIKKMPSYQLGLEEGIEEGIEKGREQGIEKGREQGMEKGREQGIERGREEGLKEGKLQIARNLLDVLSDEKIANTTGLSLEEVRKLREEKSRNN